MKDLGYCTGAILNMLFAVGVFSWVHFALRRVICYVEDVIGAFNNVFLCVCCNLSWKIKGGLGWAECWFGNDR